MWVAVGEKNSRYSLTLEERHKAQNTIKYIVQECGTHVPANEGILSEIHKFHSNLYWSKDSNLLHCVDNYIFNRTLSDDESVSCNGALTTVL